MRLARNVLEGVEGLTIFPILGLVIFLAFFSVIIMWVVLMKKEEVEAYSRLPLNQEDDSQTDMDNEYRHFESKKEAHEYR